MNIAPTCSAPPWMGSPCPAPDTPVTPLPGPDDEYHILPIEQAVAGVEVLA